jgi:hypothetical protein
MGGLEPPEHHVRGGTMTTQPARDPHEPRGTGRKHQARRRTVPHERSSKPRGAIVCADCDLVFHGGRWYVGEPPVGDDEPGVCPACRRVRDRMPAGTIRLHGIPSELHDETLALIRNTADHERSEHPLERLMALESGRDPIVVTTTGIHAARAIAGALDRRFRGRVEIHYADGDSFVDVRWT